MNPRAHFCVRGICIITNNAIPIKFRTQNPNTISTPIFAIQPSQNIPRQFSLLAAIHLFISSCDEIKISARWIKKLVAATCGVYVFIHYYNLAIASVTAGTLCPAAIYAVYTIYNTTNNAAPIKYLPQKISSTNIPTPKRFPILYIRNRDVARRFCEVLPVPNRAKKKSLISFLSTGRVAPIFVYVEYVFSPTTMCQ